jgi:CRISPR-associated protein Csb2
VTLTLRLGFPLGRYHATPWDRHVNEGVSEWPPSPWRLARAFYAVWKERCPHLSESDVEAALTYLSKPPTYRLPRALAASTRHYYPSRDHRPVANHSTSQIIDAFVALDPAAVLDLTWDEDPDDGVRATIATLAENLPYLGRADSVCDAAIVDVPDSGGETLHVADSGDLLVAVPALPLDLDSLTITTDQMRKQRLSRPPGARWAGYPAPVEPVRTAPHRVSSRPVKAPTAALFTVTGAHIPSHELAVAVADSFRAAVQSRYGSLSGGGVSPTLSGHASGTTDKRLDQHRHAHFLPLRDAEGRVDRILLWAQEGLDPLEVAAASSIGVVRSRRRARSSAHSEGAQSAESADRSVVRGFDRIRVVLAGLGSVEEVARELVGPSTTWRSYSPFVTSRHAKRRHEQDERIGVLPRSLVLEAVEAEFRARGFAGRVVQVVEEVPAPTRRPAQRYRRHRRSLSEARPGAWLRMELDAPLRGPIVLGMLCHFGLGLFEPIDD